MRCPKCSNKFNFFTRLKLNFKNSKEIECVKCKTIYTKTSTTLNSFCVGLSCFTSISLMELLLDLNNINKFLLMISLLLFLSTLFYPFFSVASENFIQYEVLDDTKTL